MYRDLTEGDITKTLLLFSLPMITGNLLQQFYSITDTLIIGRSLGRDALATVDSAYMLMTFLASILPGMSMGAGASFTICQGQGNMERLKANMVQVSGLILALTAAFYGVVHGFIDPIMGFLRVSDEVYGLMREYLWIVFAGLAAAFLYSFFSYLLRALGNLVTPLAFLVISALLNIVLDLVSVLQCSWGVAGAAATTIVVQYMFGIGILMYRLIRCKGPRPGRRHMQWDGRILQEIGNLSLLTCVQQSVMNLGILTVQELVNSFGPMIMATFAATMKTDSFTYMPVQDFEDAFSTFMSQNYGAGKEERIRERIGRAALAPILFCMVISALVLLSVRQLILIFIQPHEMEVLAAGVRYLHIERTFCWGIGCPFLFCRLYRAIKHPAISVVLAAISLRTRVLLVHTLAGPVRVDGIWAAIPISWTLADAVGLWYYKRHRESLLEAWERLFPDWSTSSHA